MAVEKPIGGLEQTILLAVMRCGSGAYGLAVQSELRNSIDRVLSLGAIYTTLERMERKGFVSSRLEEGSGVRGGRPKRIFKVEGAGIAALISARRDWNTLTSGLEGLLSPA
jgi:PadR family transcriptional regulator PadR